MNPELNAKSTARNIIMGTTMGAKVSGYLTRGRYRVIPFTGG